MNIFLSTGTCLLLFLVASVEANGYTCPGGMQPFKDTPTKGVCSCGKNWAEANGGKIKCGSSKKPKPPAPKVCNK